MRNSNRSLRHRISQRWRRFWLLRSGPRGIGRVAAWIACRHTGPYHQRVSLANLNPRGFIAPSAAVSHPGLVCGSNVYIGDRVVIFRGKDGGEIELKDRVHLYGDTFVDTGVNGRISIGEESHVQPGCHIHAYVSDIRIGKQVEIAANCGFYSYDHGMAPGTPIMKQALQSKGPIIVGDGAWIGFGVTVLQGVTIGAGAVVAAGAVVIRDIPADAIAAGVPARVVGSRAAAGEPPSGDKSLSPT